MTVSEAMTIRRRHCYMQSHLLSTLSLYVCPCVYSTLFLFACISPQEVREEEEGEENRGRGKGGGEEGEYRRVCVLSNVL